MFVLNLICILAAFNAFNRASCLQWLRNVLVLAMRQRAHAAAPACVHVVDRLTELSFLIDPDGAIGNETSKMATFPNELVMEASVT